MEYILPIGGYVKDKAHYLPVRVYYADTDFSGVVYHGRYVEFMERGRTEAMRAFGLIDTAEKERLAGKESAFFAVSKLELNFKAPAHIDDLLLVETAIEKLTGARFFIRQRIYRNDIMLTDGQCCLVVIDKEGRPQRIPDSWRALFE